MFCRSCSARDPSPPSRPPPRHTRNTNSCQTPEQREYEAAIQDVLYQEEKLLKEIDAAKEQLKNMGRPDTIDDDELAAELDALELEVSSSFPKKNHMFWGCTRCADKDPTPSCPPPPPPQIPIEEQVRRIKASRDKLAEIQQEHRRKIADIKRRQQESVQKYKSKCKR